VQVAGQFLARLLVGLDQPLLLRLQPLIELRVLQGDDRLVPDSFEQIKVILVELHGRVRADDHRPEQLEPGPQWHADGRQAIAKRLVGPQFGVVGRVVGDDRLGLAQCRADDALLAGDDPLAVFAQKAPPRDRPQQPVLVKEDGPDQRRARDTHLVQGQAAHVERLLHDALETERRAEGGGHALQRLGAVVGQPEFAQFQRHDLADVALQSHPGAAQGVEGQHAHEQAEEHSQHQFRQPGGGRLRAKDGEDDHEQRYLQRDEDQQHDADEAACAGEFPIDGVVEGVVHPNTLAGYQTRAHRRYAV